MSIKFNISNDIAQSAIDKLNKSKVNQQIVEYIAECFNIILTLYQTETVTNKIVTKRGRKPKDVNNNSTEEQSLPNKG